MKIENAIISYNKILSERFCDKCIEYAEKVCVDRLSTLDNNKEYRRKHTDKSLIILLQPLKL